MKVAKDYVLKLGFVFKEILKAGPGVFFLSIGSMIITGVSPVITTYLTAKLIEELGMNIGNETSGIYFELLAILLGMLGVVVISFATEGVKTVICSVVGLKLSHNIENHIAEKFQSIKQERIDDPEFLNLHSNTLTKSGSEPLNLMEGLFGMIANLISLVGYAGIIIKLNLWAFLIIMVFTLPIIVYKRKYQGMLFRFFNERTMQMRRIWYYLSLITDPQYCKEIREFRLYSYFRKRRKESFDDFMKGNSKIAAKEILVSVITSFISMIGAILVGVWLIKNTLTGIVSVSDFYLFVTAIITIVTKLIALSNQIASNSKSMMFINYILYFESNKRKVFIVMEENTFELYGKLNDIENSLKACKVSFLRVHQSFLVNYKHIKGQSYDFVLMDNGKKISISEDRRKMISEQYCSMEDTFYVDN